MGGNLFASDWRRNARPLSSESPSSSNTTLLTPSCNILANTLLNTSAKSHATSPPRTTPWDAFSWRSTTPASTSLRQQPYCRLGSLGTKSSPDLPRKVPPEASVSTSTNWWARSGSLQHDSNGRSLALSCLTSAPQEGDIIKLPASVDPNSIFVKHKREKFYGDPENHPLAVLEVKGDLVVCAQITSFNGDFKSKCRSLDWATQYMPLGSSEHPIQDWTLHLTPGSTVTGYINLATPLVIEWNMCEPFTPRGHSSALLPESRVRLIQQMARWDRPASAIQDPWKVRRWLHDEMPGCSLVKLATYPLGLRPQSAPTSPTDNDSPTRARKLPRPKSV